MIRLRSSIDRIDHLFEILKLVIFVNKEMRLRRKLMVALGSWIVGVAQPDLSKLQTPKVTSLLVAYLPRYLQLLKLC